MPLGDFTSLLWRGLPSTIAFAQWMLSNNGPRPDVIRLNGLKGLLFGIDKAGFRLPIINGRGECP